MEELQLDILTPTGPVDGAAGIQVPAVEVPGALGELGVLPRHTPFLTPVLPGVVRFRVGTESVRLAVGAGFLEVSEDGRVTILTDRARRPDEVDVAAAQSELEEVRAELSKEQRSLDDPEQIRLDTRRGWLEAQLRAVQG
jgi:F-type H+-transporting ATPase subunit epsilon